MKIGLFINTQWPAGYDMAARLPELRAQVRLARDCGFASLWFPDHYLTGPLQMPQPVPLAAWLAGEAEGMLIGPNIRILPLLNPVQVAEEAATMDLLTGGTYVLGVGLGYREAEFTAFDIPLAERAPRFVEQIALMRRLWAEDRVTHRGRFYTVEDAALGCRPVTPGGPPVYVAAKAEPALRRAARIGDAWLIAPSDSFASVAAQMATYRAALAEYGRTPREYPLTRECHVGASNATAFKECRAALRLKYAAYAAWGLDGRSRGEDDAALFGKPFEEFARERFIIGDQVAVKEEIARHCETLGVDHCILRVQWPGLPQEQVLASIRRLGAILA
jgi:alkanesulfonate monooxygenase SsuD/methylene tetrahydromethanopterin reductase-like flavin-dependent oxidoreductase (luciferase family)